MDTLLPDRSPPPAYSPLQASDTPQISEEARSFPPLPSSPSLEQLEIEAFGQPVSGLIRPQTRPSIEVDAQDVVDASQDPTAPPTRAPRAKRKAPAAAAQAASVTSAQPPSDTPRIPNPTPSTPAVPIQLLVEVLQPDKKVKTGAGRPKIVKVEPLKFGPKNFPSDITWDDFLSTVAQLVSADVSSLSVPSFEWRITPPKTSLAIPLTSAEGHKLFIKQVKDKLDSLRSGAPKPFVILSMQPPVENKSRLPPWASTSTVRMPSGSALADEDSDDDSQRKRARLDDELEAIAQDIEEKYPAGLCDIHPKIPCFHHKVNDLHFDLSHRPRRLVWAAAIRDGKAKIDRIPLGSTFFKAEQALKVVKKPAGSDQPEAAAFGADAPATPVPPKGWNGPPVPHYPPVHGAFPPYYPPLFMPPAPYFPPYQYPSPHHAYGRQPGSPSRAPHSRRELDDFRSSSPPAADFDLKDFCDTYRLDQKAYRALESLGFAGENLEQVPETEWRNLDLAYLEWQRIVKAAKRYRHELRK